METYQIIPSLGNPYLGSCECAVCTKDILGTEDCVSVISMETPRSIYEAKYVCSEQCATFYIIRGRE
jgi:hypothetical protein